MMWWRGVPGAAAGLSWLAVLGCTEPDTRVGADAESTTTKVAADFRLSHVGRLTLEPPAGSSFFRVNYGAVVGNRIVIADTGNRRLLWYDLGGNLVFERDRSGEGPGEFRALSSLHVSGGRLRAYDQALRRVTEFGRDGALVSTYTISSLPTPFVAAFVAGFMADGRAVALLHEFPTPPSQGQVMRSSVTVALFDSVGAFAFQVGTVPSSEFYAEPFGQAGMRQAALPFGRQTNVVPFGSRIAISDGTDWGVKLVDVDSGAESFVSPIGDYVPEEPDSAQRAHAQRVSRDFDDSGAFPGVVSLPPYGWLGFRRIEHFLVVADDGSLWSAMVTGPGEGARWRVFGKSVDIRIAESAEPVELLAISGAIAVTKRYSPLDEEVIEVVEVEGRR